MHAHPKVKHKNGRSYNDKCGGISRTKKAYDCRDIAWTKKHRICIRCTSELGRDLPKYLGHYGGLFVEWTHASMKLNFKHAQTVPVSLSFIPSTQVKLLFSIMRKTTIVLLNKIKKIPNKFNSKLRALINEIHSIHQDYLTLRLFTGVDVDDFGHGIVWFANIDRSLQTWLHGFNYETCIKRVSGLNSLDYSHLLWVIYNSEETKYGQFNDINFIIDNNKLLTNLQRCVNWRMTIDEIKCFIIKEWNCDYADQSSYFFNDDADQIDDDDYEIGMQKNIDTYVQHSILFIYTLTIL